MTERMTPSEIADWLDNEANTLGHIPMLAEDAPYLRQAAATIRELKTTGNRTAYDLERVRAEIRTVRFMDPRGGGSVTLAEQVARMYDALNAAEAKLKIATEELEAIAKGNRGEFESGDHMAFDKLMCAAQALTSIKELG